MEPKDCDRLALDRLTDALVDDILNTSDEDILAEADTGGIDPALEAAEMRAAFEKIISATNHEPERRAG